MSPTFICANCGIKISILEGSGCPGCGHVRSDSPIEIDSENVTTSASDVSASENPFKRQQDDLTWVFNFLRDEIDNHKEEVHKNYQETLLLLESKTLAVIDQSPNDESRNILYSYLSHVNKQLRRYQRAIDFGEKGISCKENFFRNQSFDSALTGIIQLNQLDKFEGWRTKARESEYRWLGFHEMKYFVKKGMMQEALEKCDECYSDGEGWDIFYRADILNTFERVDESEALFRKLTSRPISDPILPHAANSLCFSILMPQGRFLEAEEVLTRAICTSDEDERLNVYSNLAMVAFNLNEFSAAKRYASVGLTSNDNAIASESRLTISKIEYQRLVDNSNTTISEWDVFFEKVLADIQICDFDDSAEFFRFLIDSCERSSSLTNLSKVIEDNYQKLSTNAFWNYELGFRSQIEILRVDKLSQIYLDQKRYPDLEELFTQSFEYLKNYKCVPLLDYLKISFATVDFRRKCLSISHSYFLSEWASFEVYPEILLELCSNKQERILLPIAANPSSTDEILKVIVRENDVDLDFAISIRETLSSDMIEILSQSNFESVRREIAKRPNLVQSIYERLATDKAFLVRDAIRDNSACSKEIRALAALGSL